MPNYRKNGIDEIQQTTFFVVWEQEEIYNTRIPYPPSAGTTCEALRAAPRFARVVRSDRPRFARAHYAHVSTRLKWARFARRQGLCGQYFKVGLNGSKKNNLQMQLGKNNKFGLKGLDGLNGLGVVVNIAI